MTTWTATTEEGWTVLRNLDEWRRLWTRDRRCVEVARIGGRSVTLRGSPAERTRLRRALEGMAGRRLPPFDQAGGV
jgi:hypothetical protein